VSVSCQCRFSCQCQLSVSVRNSSMEVWTVEIGGSTPFIDAAPALPLKLTLTTDTGNCS
jgi:hypothetical protein